MPARPSWWMDPVVVSTGLSRRLGSVHRRLAARLLDERVAPPAPIRSEGGSFARLGASLRDGASWRAVAYSALRLPMSVLELYAVLFWVGLINMSYPFR